MTTTPRRTRRTATSPSRTTAPAAPDTTQSAIAATTAAAILSTPDPAPAHCAPVHHHVDTSHASVSCDFGGGF